jgi:REP element-mobilizing transposase RayT
MILGSHVIISAYGFWLPNDPRGSWSDFVASWELVLFGRATKTDARHSVAARSHDVASRLAAKQALRYPAVKFTGLQARAIGRGFGAFAQRAGITIWACSILPEHVHLVIARHRYKVEQVVNQLKGAATRHLLAEGLHPLACYGDSADEVPKCWGRGLWKVFLDSDADIVRSVRYTEQNPLKEGKPLQHWPFVTPFFCPTALP